jgi:hypothetical protein
LAATRVRNRSSFSVSRSCLRSPVHRASFLSVVEDQFKQYAGKNAFSAATTTESGKIAVASDKGDIRLFDSIGKIAKVSERFDLSEYQEASRGNLTDRFGLLVWRLRLLFLLTEMPSSVWTLPPMVDGSLRPARPTSFLSILSSERESSFLCHHQLFSLLLVIEIDNSCLCLLSHLCSPL